MPVHRREEPAEVLADQAALDHRATGRGGRREQPCEVQDDAGADSDAELQHGGDRWPGAQQRGDRNHEGNRALREETDPDGCAETADRPPPIRLVHDLQTAGNRGRRRREQHRIGRRRRALQDGERVQHEHQHGDVPGVCGPEPPANRKRGERGDRHADRRPEADSDFG